MVNIAIIGAGQLGSRHLQGLKLIQLQTNIFVVDLDDRSLQVAKERYMEIPDNSFINSISFLNDINELPPVLDLIIISTNSKPRASVTKNLIEHKTIKNILFEKVLFPSLHEYGEVENLLKKNEINAWVNCPRRVFEHYKKLSTYFKGKKVVFKVIGRDWGLGCNSVHFIDLFSMLTNQSDLLLDASLLDKIIHQSKRSDYIEFTGELTGKTGNGSVISISSVIEYDSPFSIFIESDNYKVVIDEGNNKMIVNGEEYVIFSKYQSELTGVMAEQIITRGDSDLATFFESSKIHQSLLSALIPFYNDLTGLSTDDCPIT